MQCCSHSAVLLIQRFVLGGLKVCCCSRTTPSLWDPCICNIWLFCVCRARDRSAREPLMVAEGSLRLPITWLCSAGSCLLRRRLTYVTLSRRGYFRGTWQVLHPGLCNLRAHCLSRRDTWWEAKMVIYITDEMISRRCSWFSLETCGRLGSNRKAGAGGVCVIYEACCSNLH